VGCSRPHTHALPRRFEYIRYPSRSVVRHYKRRKHSRPRAARRRITARTATRAGAKDLPQAALGALQSAFRATYGPDVSESHEGRSHSFIHRTFVRRRALPPWLTLRPALRPFS
jgi:hypothetical protein